MDVLKDDVGVRAAGRWYGRCRRQASVACLPLCLLDLLLAGWVSQWDGYGHAKGCLWLVEGA